MAQSWRDGRPSAGPKKQRPLDAAGLERMALRYVERYATTRAKLRDYLKRKLRERGWSEAPDPDLGTLVERFAGLGYVDDAAFASSRSASLSRRGYGPRRIGAALKIAGISEDDGREARDLARDAAWDAVLTLARRKRIGPFAAVVPDRPAREKALAAMLRAGHDLAMARRVVDALPGHVPEPDDG